MVIFQLTLFSVFNQADSEVILIRDASIMNSYSDWLEAGLPCSATANGNAT